MKITYNVRLVILTALLASLSFFGCKKESSDTSSGKTELLSFGPTGAQPGDTIRFFGNNLNTVTEIDFTNASVASSNFISQTSKEIHVVVPGETEKGYVTLKTPSGDITSKTQFNIGVAAVITSVTDVARPGETITINGDYLNWVTSVTFNDGKIVTSFVSQSKNELQVMVPVDAQTGTLVLAYGGTDSSFVESADTLHVTLPMTTALSPNPLKHAYNVAIRGTDLDLVTKVYFTGVSDPVTDFVSQSATQIVVKVPGATLNGKVTLEAASGVQTTSSMDLNMVMPAITTMSPNPVDPLANLTITGTNLDLVNAITFQNAAPVTTFVTQSPTQIVVKVPKGLTEGAITLSVVNSTVQVTSPMDLNLVKPAITTMSPNPIDPETSLTITGTNLNLVSAIAFQNADPVTTFVSQSPTKLVVKIPKGVTEGKITLSVLNASLTVQSTDVLKITGAIPPPVIAFPIYNDAITSNWNGWVGDGWGGTRDYSNTSPVREGDKSISINYVGSWGAPLQLGEASVSIGSYTTFKISIYGATGSNGKSLLLQLNGDGGQAITIVEGKWTDYSFPISSLISGSTITDMILKENSGVGGFTVYVDDIGLN